MTYALERLEVKPEGAKHESMHSIIAGK